MNKRMRFLSTVHSVVSYFCELCQISYMWYHADIFGKFFYY